MNFWIQPKFILQLKELNLQLKFLIQEHISLLSKNFWIQPKFNLQFLFLIQENHEYFFIFTKFLIQPTIYIPVLKKHEY